MSEHNSGNDDQLHFPYKEVMEDFAGRKRTFVINVYTPPIGGYQMVAEEVVEDSSDDGYVFETYSESSLTLAYGKLKGKMKKGLSTRYLEKSMGTYFPRHDEMAGTITYGGVVVDGIFLDFEDVSKILEAHEGFQFKLSIVEASEDLL